MVEDKGVEDKGVDDKGVDDKGVEDKDDGAGAKVMRGLLAGVIAGAVASFAMDRFQAAVTAMSSDDSDSEPATEQAADAVAVRVAGAPVPKPAKPLAGQAMHYALGLGLGAAYGVVAEFYPAMTAGYGAGFGVATATLLDEAAVPALGLGEPPWRSGPATHLFAYASHLVFGGVAELTRRQVQATLQA